MPKPRQAQIYERDALDWYVEPARCTAQLLAVETFAGPIHDPCCGRGNVVQACYEAGHVATGTDLVARRGQRAGWYLGERDFLTEPWRYTNIVMNPPFFGGKGAEAFIRRALGVASGKVCVFVDRRFLTSSKRAAGLYAEHPPTRVWEITPRPSCPPGEYLEAGNEAGGGTADYAWIVWSLTEPKGRTELGWLRGGSGAATCHSVPPPSVDSRKPAKPRRRRKS